MRMVMIISGMVVMLFAGVVMGIHSAENHIQKLHGTEGETKAIQITPQDGKIEIEVLGQTVQAKNPVPQEKIEAMKQVSESNVLGEMGNQMGIGLRETTRKLLGAVFAWMGESF